MRSLFTFISVCSLLSAAEIPWLEAPARLNGKQVKVVLRDGSHLEGKWIGVTSDTFTIQSKDRSRNIARDELDLAFERTPRVRGRVIGLAAGYFGGTPFVVAASSGTTGSRKLLLFALAPPAAGYLLGRSFDKQWHPITFGP